MSLLICQLRHWLAALGIELFYHNCRSMLDLIGQLRHWLTALGIELFNQKSPSMSYLVS